MRNRVEAAVRELGYVFDSRARNLRTGAPRDVGVVVTNLRDSFYCELATAIEAGLRERAYNMILATDDGSENEQLAAIDRLLSMRVAGIILTSISAAAVERVHRSGTRVVQVDRIVGDVKTDAVVSSNARGAYEAAHHLLEHGHRKIAVVVDETLWTTTRGRLKGFHKACAEWGVSATDDYVLRVPLTIDAARVALGSFLDRHPEVTAIMAMTGLLAEAAFVELQARELVLPTDISLMAYDDVPWMAMVRPGITTVNQHTAVMGRAAAKLMLQGMSEQAERRPVTRSIAPSLVVRGSVDKVAEIVPDSVTAATVESLRHV